MSQQQQPLRLLTIRFSHFCERARWALDRYNVKYEEMAFLPGLHMKPVMKATKGTGKDDAISSRASTPALLLEDGSAICDSTEILHYISKRFSKTTGIPTLYPESKLQEIQHLEKRFHDNLGPTTRRIAYHYVLQDQQLSSLIAYRNVDEAQAKIWIANLKQIRGLLGQVLNLSEEEVKKSIKIVQEEFDFISKRLQQNGTKYLVGDEFTAADLTFAALTAPILLITPEEGYNAVLPSVDQMQPAFQEICKPLRETVAAKFALKMFKEHRGQKQIPLEPLPLQNNIKSAL